jgi:hypothetical protein
MKKEKEKKVKHARNVTGPFQPKQPNLFRPFISKWMAKIVFALYKRSQNPISLPPLP